MEFTLEEAEKRFFYKNVRWKILSIKKSIYKLEYRILVAFGVDRCKCPKCGNIMEFYDIAYERYGSIIKYLRKKVH